MKYIKLCKPRRDLEKLVIEPGKSGQEKLMKDAVVGRVREHLGCVPTGNIIDR